LGGTLKAWEKKKTPYEKEVWRRGTFGEKKTYANGDLDLGALPVARGKERRESFAHRPITFGCRTKKPKGGKKKSPAVTFRTGEERWQGERGMERAWGTPGLGNQGNIITGELMIGKGRLLVEGIICLSASAKRLREEGLKEGELGMDQRTFALWRLVRGKKKTGSLRL